MTNRVMRLNRNPAAKGFVVRVLEETGRQDELGIIDFKVIAAEAHGTKAAAHKAYDRLRAEHGAR